MDDPKSQLLAKLRDSANVLVTVTANPSVDQLAGAIGLTLLLNKLGKHATAIFSGNVPEVMEFLKPETTLEKNTDSLRDFIIALDKAKADKLRYKVEDTMVKIFITPYHSALTEKDLQFSQGDYNVDLIVAIGAHAQADLDKAITSHGQILHDAVISSINNQASGNFGTINWVDGTASSLCEMIFDLTRELQPDGLDPQMATALLTGIVSETRRFGNDKTTAKSLETSSLLVTAGANQQLVATQLEEKPAPIPEKKAAPVVAAETNATDTHKDPEAIPQTSGTVMIDHEEGQAAEADDQEINIDDQGQLHVSEELPEPTPQAQPAEPSESVIEGGAKLLEPLSPGLPLPEPPTGEVSTNVDPLSNSLAENDMPLLSHDSGPAQPPSATPPSTYTDIPATKTLAEIESSVGSPHTNADAPDLDNVRSAVDTAANAMPDFMPKPAQALNAQTVDLETSTPSTVDTAMPSMSFSTQSAPAPLSFGPTDSPTTPSDDSASPPPVPPPMMPGFTTTEASPAASPPPVPADVAL